MFAKTAKKCAGFALVSIIFVIYIHVCYGFHLSKFSSVKFDQTVETESIEIFLSGKTDYYTFNLQNPDRFVLDLKNCYFPKLHDVMVTESAHVKTVRVSQFRPDMVRLVIDQKTVSHIAVQEKELFNGFVLSLSVQLPEVSASEKSIPSVALKPSQLKQTEKSKEPVDKPAQGGDVADTSKEFFDESLNSLFNTLEGFNAMPNGTEHDDQTGSIAQSSKLSMAGDLRNETAYRTNKPHHFSKIKNTFNLSASGSLSGNLSYFLGSRFSYDAVFDFNEDHYNSTVENDQRTMADLRDAYVDIGFGNFDFRLGNQQIVWGQAVGLFFADIVNPKNLREYILPDLDQVRIPVLAANMEYYHENLYFQMIFIPFPEFNEFGKPGSEFDFSKSLYSENWDLVFNSPSEPANSIDKSEVGFRVSRLTTQGWDLSVFYFYDMYNFPVNYRSVSVNTLGSQHPFTITYSPKYERIHRIGSTFSKAVMDAILKGEFIYSDKMFFQTFDITDLDGIEKSDTFDWLLGVDYTFFNRLETNFQLMQSILLDYQTHMIQKQITTSFSIWLKTGFFSNLIEPELFFVSSLNQRDFLFRPKMVYNYGNMLKFIVGGDFFYGETDGNFGQFDDNNRVYLEILYGF